MPSEQQKPNRRSADKKRIIAIVLIAVFGHKAIYFFQAKLSSKDLGKLKFQY